MQNEVEILSPIQQFSNYQQQVAKKSDAYLGRLCWYSITEVKVDHAQLLMLLQQHGVQTPVPAIPADVDVFRRICSNANVMKRPGLMADEFRNFLVRPTNESDPEVIRRLIVEETVNKTGKRLSYRELYSIDFQRNGSLIAWAPISGDPNDVNVECEEICSEINKDFTEWRGCLNSYSVRELVKRIIFSANGIKVRESGGVYFVGEENAALLEGLESFVQGLPGTSTFHSLPLVDDAKQRDMIRNAFESESSEAIDAKLQEIQDIMQSGKKISADRYAGILGEFQALSKKNADYQTLLEDSLGISASRLSIFQTMVVNLRSAVK